MHAVILACVAAVASARPSFIAVPADQIAFLDLSRLHVRVPRQTLSPPPPPPPPQPPQPRQDLFEDELDGYEPIPLQQYQQQPIGLVPPAQHLEPITVAQLQQLQQHQLQNGQLQQHQLQNGQLLQHQLQNEQLQQHQLQNEQLQQHQQLRQQSLPQDVASAASLGASQRLAERPPDFGEYVDFGAHTGDNGAFGWYADYPINQYEDHSKY